MNKIKYDLKGREIRNSGWIPGMSIQNASGDIDPAGIGYDYAIRTTTFIRSKVIQQKFYKIAPADFMTVEVGNGAWMEKITQPLQYDNAAGFETGIINTGKGEASLDIVDTGISNKDSVILTWAKGYRWAIPELQKALASNNWDIVQGKVEALKRNWDLGIQDIAFLGSKSLSTVTGLLTSADVTSDTTNIPKNIALMSADEFQTLVAALLGAYFSNSNSTQLPNTFLMPMDDYLGMAAAASSGFPNVSKLFYLAQAFKEITGNASFQIKGLAYCQATYNAGRTTGLGASGLQRYALYNNDPETLRMDIPVDFTLSAPGTSDNFYWHGVGYGQFTGCTIYRPAEVLYFDHAA
jgi:hypothetical protein